GAAGRRATAARCALTRLGRCLVRIVRVLAVGCLLAAGCSRTGGRAGGAASGCGALGFGVRLLLGALVVARLVLRGVALVGLVLRFLVALVVLVLVLGVLGFVLRSLAATARAGLQTFVEGVDPVAGRGHGSGPRRVHEF